MADGRKAKCHNYKHPASDQRLFRDGLVERRLKDVKKRGAHDNCRVPDAGGKDSKQQWFRLVDRHPMRYPEHKQVMHWHDPQKPSNGGDQLGSCKAVGTAMCSGRDWIQLPPEDTRLHPNLEQTATRIASNHPRKLNNYWSLIGGELPCKCTYFDLHAITTSGDEYLAMRAILSC